MVPPKGSLPLGDDWPDDDAYVDSLLNFVTSSEILRNLCGGIHILDFLTRQPDLYTTVLPEEWRAWFDKVKIEEILELLLRTNIEPLLRAGSQAGPRISPPPPVSLLEYIQNVRKHCLGRKFEKCNASCDTQSPRSGSIPRQTAVGMKPKKMHEVQNFARFVDKLNDELTVPGKGSSPRIVDFGSGQNYLGRTLASPPYNKHVIAIERKHHNIDGAKGMDIYAKLAPKPKVMRNKKQYRRTQNGEDFSTSSKAPASHRAPIVSDPRENHAANGMGQVPAAPSSSCAEKGSLTYVEHEIEDGHLDYLNNDGNSFAEHHIERQPHNTPGSCANLHERPRMMVVSLHSCGNLLHHGLRSLVLNPEVSAVAMVGCCYNLMTERLGPATYKLPILRPHHPRLVSTSNACDPHGFPMSKRLEHFQHKQGVGVRLNITARMMAVQAPYNWGPEDSRDFFTRHFYRALFQRILLDRKVVNEPSDPDRAVESNPAGTNAPGKPLVVGSLKRASLVSFVAYVRGALLKLSKDPGHGSAIREVMGDLADDEIRRYEESYQSAKKSLSIIWSLMAFSASVVESVIVVDRWLFLREQEVVRSCWVEPVFDYAQSPRNLVVVGVKDQGTFNNSLLKAD